MKKRLTLLLAAAAIALGSQAQRIQQSLGRGVVAVQSGTKVTVTWRKLAQEAEDATYNIYVRKNGATEYTKLNATPYTKTNYATTTSTIPVGSDVAVSIIVDGKESALSKPFCFKSQSLRNIYMEIEFKGGPLKNADYSTKFVWPCDLNGDGEYDYVVDRNPVNGVNHFLEAYLADGTYLWTVDLGPNELSSSGQDDQICAYDIDCDGYGEVLVQTSDGTRFWNKENNTWGLYVNGSSTGDTDGDGIIDYNSQTTKNAPKYFTVINGMTGAEKASVEQTYDNAYNRTNKASLMGEEYNKHVGHVGIFYHDGIHPAVVMEWHTRTTGGTHMYRNSAWAYDFSADGKASNWHQLFMKNTGGEAFHQIRIADVDGDGKDEMIEGAYTMDHDGSTLFDTKISHGDRHRTSDIDPERPGLETFAIQQDAGDMLAQILYDAKTGEAIKKWYLPAVGDVGRGECLDIDKDHLGWEMFSTMDGYQMFDAKGNKIEGKVGYFPTEGIWWDGELDRERVDSPDGNGYNADIRDYVNGRLIEMGKESGYTIKSSNAKRGKFWGDIIGDWREELILNREIDGVNTGIVGFTTDIATSINNIYCLQEDPHYRGDCTTKGYYQSPDPGFYLGYDMPRPQLPPCMRNDSISQVFDLTLGNATIHPKEGMKKLYAMPVINQTLTLSAPLTGDVELWKSQQGCLVLTGNNTSSANTIISEGTLQVDGSISGNVELRARGTLSGKGSVGSITLEGAMNSEWGRIMPTDTLTVNSALKINKKTFVEIDITKNALLHIEGNMSITSKLIFTINATEPKAGEYTLLSYTGTFSGLLSNVSVNGLKGIAYDIINKDNAIRVVIRDTREASSNVIWTGATSSAWDYKTVNWSLNDEAVSFVAGDSIVFNDNATKSILTISSLMPVGGVTFENSTKSFTLSGTGGFSGTGGLTKNGTGSLTINNTASDFTGPVVLNEGKVTVKELADAGIPSSLGAASADASNLQLDKVTLVINNSNTATNRGITLVGDTATISNASGSVSLKGIIKGNGTLKKAGAGQLNITYAGANQWASTILSAGTLAMGAWNTTFGKATSPIHVTGNSTLQIFDNNSTSAVPNFQNTLEIDSARTLTFKGGSRCAIRGKLLGKGTLKISFPYVRGDISTDCSSFQGTYEVASANCRLVQAIDLSKATLRIDADGNIFGAKAGGSNVVSYNHKVGALESVYSATTASLGTGSWTIGYLNTDSKYYGTIASDATITKVGLGNLSLYGSTSGTINLNEGTLTFNTVMTTTGNITTKTGTRLIINVKVPATLAEGEDLKVINCSGKTTLGGDVEILPAEPKTGYQWDTTDLASKGVIRMVPAQTGIVNVNDNDNDNDNSRIYDLSGRRINTPTKGSVFIKNRNKYKQ